MRKFFLGFFILFYSASVVGMTMERTENWAAERAQGRRHTHSGGRSGLAESHRRPTHIGQTKLLEDGSVLVSSFVRCFDPPYSETPLHNLLAGFLTGHNGRTTAPR